MSTTEIQKMTNKERLAVMEKLWDAICRDSDEVVSPDWHRDVLEARKRRMDEPSAQYLTVQQLRDRLR